MTVPLVLFHALGIPVSLFSAFIVFMWLVYLWDSYLDCRQHWKIQSTTEVPEELADVIDNENLVRSKSYALDKSNFAFVRGVYSIIQQTCILYFAIIPWLWEKSQIHGLVMNEYINNKTGINLGINRDSEIRVSLLFLTYASIFSFIDSIPWSLYSNFVVEARHGFNKQTLKFFIKDKIKAFVISLVIGFPIISVLIWIIKVGGPNFYVYAYMFALVVTIFMMFIYPEFIAPLFDRYEPLPEGSLREKIEALASSIAFPLKKLLVVEGSKRSAHSNAYFYGFGKNKRIVIYDTLIRGFKFPNKGDSSNDVTSQSEDSSKGSVRGCSVDEEVVAVLAHELGHWKKGHTLIYLLIGQVNLLLMFAVFSTLMNEGAIFTSFGFVNYVPILLRLLVVFQFIFSPYNTIVDFLMTVLSRRLEFQADRFAVSLNFGTYLKRALVILHKDNLSFPVSDWMYSMFNYSHPPMLERLQAIDASLSKSN